MMKLSMRPALLLLLVPAYWLLSPAGVNGDGIGYLNQISGQGLSPGHPGYLPLLRVVAALAPRGTPLELAPWLRLISVCCAAGALWLFFDACARVTHSPGAVVATALLGGSHAFFRSATEIEAYAPAALCAVATLWAMIRHRQSPRVRYAVVAGAAAGLAVAMHLTLALLALPVATALARSGRGGWRHALMALAVLAAVAGGIFALALGTRGVADPAGAWAWLAAADHGMPYRHDLLTPLRGLWGLCRALVHSPYPYEAPMARVILLTGVGAASWFVLAWLRWRPVVLLPHRAPLDRLTLLAWIAPLAAFALYFYPSDTERWIFVLPAILLYLAPALGHRLADGKRGPSITVAGLVLVCNAAIYQLPAAMDTDSVSRAALVDRLVSEKDLVVSPGHGWDELIGLSVQRPARRYTLVFHAGVLGGVGPAEARMHRQIRATFRSGARVYAARLRDRNDRRGFKELQWFGLSEEGYLDLFRRYGVKGTGMVGLWEMTLKKK